MNTINILIENYEKITILLVIIFMFIAFLRSRWRYDIISIVALFALTILGLLPADQLFLGFVDPIVIIIISMLIISKALINAGLVDVMIRAISPFDRFASVQLFILLLTVSFASAFIFNIGALALTIPIAIKIARKKGISPSAFILPLAFAAHMGGYMTLIGNAPNLIVSRVRFEQGFEAFKMFDFSPVGISITLVSTLFMAFVGWRIVPKRNSASQEVNSQEKNYLSEVHVPITSPFVGQSIENLQNRVKMDFVIHRIIRGDKRIPHPSKFMVINSGDVLVVQADTDVLTALIDFGKISLLPLDNQEIRESEKDLETSEVIVSKESTMIGKNARQINLNGNYGVSLLAIHRDGEKIKSDLQNTEFRSGDVLLIQGVGNSVAALLNEAEWYSLSGRNFRVNPSRITAALLVFGVSIAISVFNFFPIHLLFSATALILVFMNYVPVNKLYSNIDGALVVLIGAMVQIGIVFEQTGLANDAASLILSLADCVTPLFMLGIILVISMWMSDLLNNVTVGVLMAPIAVLVANGLGASIDPFLIAVAIGAGSSYLTPVGHQANILVMNVGGYKFSDYWKLGLPLQILIVIVALPVIAFIWPL